ncbi:MAG: hypothetical protein CVU41_05565 [Chloroflexi bacterium HGW-Chloroflexi-3]|nr:MAG: hypothetical protein CVU41_05565 [Chloroflexi bacterium HGW-Chloroflexi-3]
MKIFLTGIVATPYAREYLSKFAITLRKLGHEVFVPHENSWKDIANPWDENRFNFVDSCTALQKCRWLVAILDGYTIDDGVAFQAGMFFGFTNKKDQKRKMIGVLHDTRVAGWTWTAGDKALCAQVRDAFRECGEVVPNFASVQALLEAEKG